MIVVNKFLIIALVLLFNTGFAPKTILFFGDSITAGYGLSQEDAYPAHVEAALVKKGMEVKVVNAGLSGETSAGGLSRIDWILRQPIDVFVLELGANDGLRGLPLDQTRTNLQSIIDKVKAKNPEVKIVLAGMMVPPNLGKEYTTEFKNIYPDLAKANKAELIPFLLEGVAGDGKLNIADGIHPNVAGHKVVAKTVLQIVEPLLK
ncbi:MAG: arylesterase [Cyclobacteriaceae bacterium]|nr:arylesterase [Cyclobacteriaceae bacterium]